MYNTQQPAGLVAQRGSRALPAIISAIVVLVIAAFLLAVQSLATTGAIAQPGAGANATSQQLDSPALRKFDAGAATSQQLDSPALRGGYHPAVAVPTTTSIESTDAMRKEHLGIAPATIKAAPVVTPSEDWNAARMEHLGQFAKSQAGRTVTGRDRIEIHRLEHLGKAPASLDTWGGGR